MWKDIGGFEGRYEISEDGVIRNATNGRTLTSALDSDGYKQIGIRKLGDRKKYWFKIHRLVAFAFLELPDNYASLQIDHIDRDKTNNKVENLRHATQKTNVQNSGRHKMTEEKKDMAIKMQEIGASTASIARALNVHYGSVKYFFKSLVFSPFKTG